MRCPARSGTNGSHHTASHRKLDGKHKLLPVVHEPKKVSRHDRSRNYAIALDGEPSATIIASTTGVGSNGDSLTGELAASVGETSFRFLEVSPFAFFAVALAGMDPLRKKDASSFRDSLGQNASLLSHPHEVGYVKYTCSMRKRLSLLKGIFQSPPL